MNERVDMMRNTNVTEQGNPSWETYFPKTVDDAVMITNDQGNIPNTEAQTLKEKLADMSNASGLTVKDTEGMLGEALKNVNLQTLIDTIADKVLNELMAKSQIATSIENSTSTVPASSLLYQLNSDMRNTLKTFNYSGIMFDFNKDDYPAGLYRLGAEEYMQNSPSISLAYSVMLVLKHPSQDTLAMIGFSFNNQGVIVFRQGNTNNWATANWFKIEGVAI